MQGSEVVWSLVQGPQVGRLVQGPWAEWLIQWPWAEWLERVAGGLVYAGRGGRV